jgi:hypothetical protein
MKAGTKVVTGSQAGVLSLFDWKDILDLSDRFPGHPQSVDAMVAWDEDVLLTGSSDGVLRIISVLPNRMLGVVGEHSEWPVERLALSADRVTLASASHDSTVKLWDISYLREDGTGAEGAEEEAEAEEREEQPRGRKRGRRRAEGAAQEAAPVGRAGKRAAQRRDFFRDLGE